MSNIENGDVVFTTDDLVLMKRHDSVVGEDSIRAMAQATETFTVEYNLNHGTLFGGEEFDNGLQG